MGPVSPFFPSVSSFSFPFFLLFFSVFLSSPSGPERKEPRSRRHTLLVFQDSKVASKHATTNRAAASVMSSIRQKRDCDYPSLYIHYGVAYSVK
ncbi:hypothetical protein L209DRAFT_752457 [Thermothelomyces heterothallicus CBS 203.75]